MFSENGFDVHVERGDSGLEKYVLSFDLKTRFAQLEAQISAGRYRVCVVGHFSFVADSSEGKDSPW